MDLQLDGLRVVVTAGASGIGLATARAFAREGARVHVCDVDRGALDALAQSDPALLFTVCDVSDRRQVSQMFDAALGALGGLDVLVNNAGITDFCSFMDMTEENWDRVMSINLKSMLLCTQAVLPDMMSAKWGRIINISSSSAQTGSARMTAYAASKGGVAAMTLPAARELARSGIRVVTIAPGLMETPMLAGLPPEAVAKLRALPPFPSGRLGHPEEFAALVLHAWANPLLNGCVLRLDAGLRMPP